MPDFQQQQPTLPPLPQQQQPALQTPAPPQLTPMDRINQATQDLQKTLPNWVNSNFVTPYQTRLDQTLRYNDPNIGYNPMDANLEDKYAQAHYLKTFGNNLLQGGARFLGTAAEAIATIPLAVDAVVNKDFTKLYDNDLTNSIHQWFNTLDTTLPVYQTNFEQQHPILKYLNPLQPKALLGAFGNAFNNFGFTAGAIAGSLVEDAVVTAATGGPGLFPALAANGVQFTKMLARASRAIVGGAEDVKAALKTGEAVADAATAGEVSTVLRNRAGEGLQDVGSNINSQNLTNFDEVRASQKTQELKQAIANNATYFKIRDAAKYNLALLTSATAEASFEAVDVYHRGLDQLKQQYFEEYGTVPTGDDLQRIERISHQSANIDMGANIGFLYMMNRVNWGSLFKPTTQAFDEAITGWGGSIARTTVTKDAEAAVGNSAYKVISNAPETKIGKILLNGEKLYKIGFQSINEAIEEGSQFIMSEGSMDYNMRKYNAKHRGDVVDGMASFLAGVDKTFNTNEGWDNMMGGFVGGIFGSEIMHKVLEGRGQTSAQKQMQIQADLLNQASFNGTFENKIQEAAVQTSLAEDHKDAVQQQDKLGAKNIKFNMLYNWVTSGIRANSFDKRMEELDAVRDLQGKSFQDYWGKEDNAENRAEVNGFLDNLQRQANNIKDVYTRIDRLTKNPYDQKANPLDHEAYNSYKDQLALNIALSDNYRERINDMQTELHKVSPLMDIQKAVNLTSIAGLRDTLKGIDKAQSDLAEQIQMAKEAKTDPELTANLINKHKALTKLFAELQPLVIDSKTGEQSNNVTEAAFDGKKYVDVLQKLYALHDGSSFLNNKYINKFAQPAIHINQEGEAEVVSHDELAEHLQTLQDIYSLSKANLNVQRFYNFLRKGAGATEFMDTLKRVNLEQLAKYMNKEGEIKSPAELQDEIEQDIRFKTPEPENVEEATKEERDIITQAAKKIVSGDELTDKEKNVTTQKPQRFAHEVKIQEATQQQVNERFGEQAEPTTDNTIKPTVRSKIKVKDLFGMFSQDHNTTKNRSNLYKAIFKSPEVFSKLTATYTKAEPQTTFFKLIPNTKIFRSEFKDNITIFHNGQPIGILRPQDSLWLDEGKRTIYDMTPEEFTDVTGHPAEQYQAFMDELRAYQTAYNNFKQSLINSKDNVALTFDDINKFFDLSINTGAAVQNRYTITNAKGKFQVVDPKNVVVQNFNTLAQAQTWIKQNNNTLSRYDTLLKDLNYKPKGTALISFVNNIDLGGGTTVEPNIVNKDQLTQQQLSNVISFLANNADHFKNNANRYVVLLPIDNQYSLKAAIFARNADATHDEQQDYFNKIKQVASGLITGDKLNDLINDLYAKYFVANQDRTVKQTFITTTFSEDSNLILSINNPSQKVYKNIVINKAEIQNTTTYGDLMKLLQSNINNESIKDTGLAKLQIQLTEDSLKRQIPDDEDITKLSQIDTKLRLATTPDVFSNYTINFTPKGYAATEETPSAKPTEQVAQTEVKPEVQDAAKAVRDEYLQKRAALQKDFNDSLTPAEKSIKQTLTTNPALAKDTTNLLKQANATQADLLSYSKKASQYNEQFRVYQAIEQQKLANPTNTDVAIYARTKAGIVTIAKDLFNLPDEQANAVAEIYDANAQAWAARTGNTVADYYKQLGFKSQLDQPITNPNILEQYPAIQKVIDYLKLQPKKISINKTGYVSENGSVGVNLANRVGEVIKQQNLQDLVGARWNKTDNAIEFFPIDRQGTLFQMAMPDGTKKNVKPLDIDVVNGFYSPLEKIINETKFDKLPVKQWIDKFAKGEEAKWTGLSDWLAQQQGSVSKADIQKYLKDNKIQIVEVVKQDERKGFNDALIDLNEYQNSLLRKYGRDWHDKLDASEETKRSELENKMNELRGDATKFSDYQVKGQKENYKEILVTLPSSRYDLLTKKIANGTITDAEYSEYKTLNSRPKGFQSTHFNEPNILVHLRMNTRIDTEGNKVLFLEEIQSDWGQKGKRNGFKTISPNQAKYDELLAEENKANAYVIKLMRKVHETNPNASIASESIHNKGVRDAWENYTKLSHERLDLLPEIRKSVRGVNSAPFVTDTNAWTKLGLKVALKEAVKGGADKISWTNGEQQNDRYDLNKYIDSIDYSTNEDGTYNVSALKNGINIHSISDAKLNTIADTFGKDIAEKIHNEEGKNSPINSTQKRLEGVDLQIGGKGMIGFYGSPKEDKLGIVGNVAKSLFKQEPKTIDIQTAPNSVDYYSIWNKETGNSVSGGYSLQEAKNKVAQKPDIWEYRLESKANSPQYSIDITPELKAQVEQGQPLFQNDGNAKAAYDKLTNTIYALTNPDVTSPLHELAHSWEQHLNPDEVKQVLDWAKTDTWTRETSEKFASGFELYMAEGNAPKGLKALFDKFAQWLQNVIQKVKALFGQDFELNDNMRNIYSKMLNSEHIKTTEEAKQAITEAAPAVLTPDNIEYQEQEDGSSLIFVKDNNGQIIKNPNTEDGSFKLQEAKDFIKEYNSKLEPAQQPEQKQAEPVQQEHILEPLKELNYGDASKIQHDLQNGFYEQQIRDKQLTPEQVKAILKSAGLSESVVDGIVFKINNPDLIKALQQGVPEGINITYLRSDLNAAIKDGRFGEAIRNGELTEEHAKNILDYFNINQSKFKQDFEAAAQAQQQAVTPTEQAPLTDSELSFINLLKENQADLKGIHGNIIKDLLDMEDYHQVIDMLHNYLQADTNQAKVIFNNPAVYKAFLQLVNKEEGETEAGDVLAAHAKDVYEPEEQTPTEQVAEQLTPQEKYVHYKEAVNGEVVQKIGKIVEDNGFTSLIETPTGEQFDRVTAQLTPATKEEFDDLKPAKAKPTSVDNGKYNPGDKVIYGQNNDVYTIEYPTTIPNDSGVEEMYYTTEEGPVIKESGIRDLARKTKVTEILQEHKGLEKRKATLERIAKRFTQLFPDIKYLIGDFDFNAPARFNKGVVEVNVSYQIANDKSISRERMANKLAELEAQKDAGMDYNKKLYADLTSKLQSGLNFYNVDEANAALYKDAFTTPWLKREAVAHEFMHPFILALKQSNSVLYNNLINELNKTQKPILDHVDNLIKSGTYSEENRNDEALAIYLGKSITDAFDKNGELKPDYVIGAKKRLFRRFLDWLTDIIDYLRGKRKTIKLEDFIKNANSDIDAQRDLIRSLIKEAPLLQELYSTKHKSDLIKTINYVKRTMGEAFNEDGSINEEHFNTGLQHLVDELSSKQQQQSAKAAKLDAKVFERPSGENPVYRVVVNGEDRFIQRQENLGGVAQWFEVVKRKELWEAPNGKTGTEADGLLGDSKVEALENLGKEVNPIKAANPEKLSQLADAISNFLQQKPTGRFEFIISPSEDTDVKFDETDPEHIKVYIDPDFADDITAPSTLLRYGQRDIIDNDAAEEFKNLVQRNYYMAGNYKDREASIGVKTLNPLMSLQDVSDFIVKQLNDKEYNIKYTNPELDAIDELEAYMELTEPEAAKIRERVVKRLQQLKDVAEVRLNNHTLKNEYNIVKGISLDESDVDFVLKYIERAGIGINLAWRKYNELRQDLQDPNLTQATLNRLNKDLDVVKQLVSFYDDFSQLYNNYEDEFNDEDLTKFRKSVANWQRLRDSMNETAINLAVKWMLPYAEKHNEYIKQQGYTDPKYFVTQKTLYDNFKYGADKDTNFITYNLGANVTSRDPVNAIFANIVADMLSINNINIVNNAFDVNEGYAQFLKDHNISANSSKAQVEYYKTHYMRHAEILQSKYDEKTNTYKDEYVKKLALHQEFYFDQYQKDLAAEREKYKNPRNSEEAEQFTEALNRWQLDHNYGKTEKYRNKQYTALQNDKFFKLLEHHYNESNAKYGENKLQYGIIPQKYDVGTIERLKRIVQAGKSKEGLREVMDKAQMHLAGIKKDNTSLNLDDTLHRVVRSELTQAKEERNLDLNLHNSIIDMITEATNYASLKEVQYNVENLRSLIEGNHKFNIDSRKIAKQDFEANVRNSIQLRNAKVEFKALNKLKDAGQPYDEARYKQLEEKIAKGAPKLKLWDRLAGTVKSSETARLNDQLIQFINDTFYGESVEEEKLGKISLNKAAHYLSMYTSINNMAFNTIAGVSNVVIGDVQMMIEAHGGKYFNKKDLAWATADYYKNMANYLGDLKNPIKSKDTQISFLLDAIQGEIQDEFGTRISGNITRRMFNAGSLFFFTSVGEHQIQTIGMKAMLKAKKVTTDDGKTISLYDAYVKDANGRYSLRKDINFTNDDLQHFIRQLHGVNRSLNGNYSDLHKSTLQRKWYGTLMLKFRKYIYEAFRTRYSSEHTDFEKNTVEQGYMNFFLNDYLYKNFKNLPWNQKFAFISNYNKLNENQKYAMRKAGMELGIFLGAMILTMAFFGGGDPEHKKDLTTAQKTLLLYSLRLQNDLGMFHVQMPSEFVRQTKSPTASMTSIVSLANLLGQLYKPTEVYQQSGNGHEAGDNKLMAKFKKMLPVISKFPIDVDSKLGYFNMVNQNIQGVSPKQSF